MGLVLAVDPGHRQTLALERLRRDLAGHEIVVVSSCDEALDVLETRLPDLVLFPLFFSPADEARLQSRLRALPSLHDIRAFTIPFAAYAECEKDADRPTAVPPRWFYWFRPEQVVGMDVMSPAALLGQVRAELQHPSASAVVPDPGPSVVRAWAPSSPMHHHPSVETIVIDSITSQGMAGDDGGEPENGPDPERRRVEAATSDTDVWARGARDDHPTAVPLPRSVVEARTDDPLGRLVALGSRVPRGSYLAVSALAVLLMLGVSGRALVSLPLKWLNAARTSAFSPSTAETAATGVALLQSNPDGAHVFIGGREIGITPLRAELAAGTHTVEFRHRGSAQTMSVTVEPGATVARRVEWTGQRSTGTLRVETQPQGAVVLIDGVAAGKTPLVVDNLAAGHHDVELTLGANAVKQAVRIEAGKTTTLDTGVYVGWLALFSPIELTVRDGGKKLSLDERNRVLLAAGTHSLTLENQALGFRTERTVEIRSGEVTAESFEVPKTQLTVTASSPAEVWVDGAKAGPTPLVDWPVDIGTRDVVLRSDGRADHTLTVTATVQPVHVNVDFP